MVPVGEKATLDLSQLEEVPETLREATKSDNPELRRRAQTAVDAITVHAEERAFKTWGKWIVTEDFHSNEPHDPIVVQGKVIVERGAQKTDGKQMANALLLSDDAEFDSKPELEIFADDVVCGHGSTAGQLDDDMLFYLRARGIPEPEARALLIAAFVGEAFDKIDNEALRAALDEKVAAWLAGGPARLGPAR